MGNGYNHHFQYQRNLNNIQKSTFLPMLCSRTSIKDVALPRLEDRCASSSKEDPLSPKIGCMGQVKRNNKIIGFPTATTSHNSNNNNKQLALTTKTSSNNFNVSDVKYFKLKRFFSVRNIVTYSNNNNNTSCTVSSCRRRETNTHGARPKAAAAAGNENKEREACIINIAQMDPPLPVVKRVPKPAADQAGDENNSSLWKRRSNGGALKNLDLQHIQIPRHQVEIRTV